MQSTPSARLAAPFGQDTTGAAGIKCRGSRPLGSGAMDQAQPDQAPLEHAQPDQAQRVEPNRIKPNRVEPSQIELMPIGTARRTTGCRCLRRDGGGRSWRAWTSKGTRPCSMPVAGVAG